MQEKQAGAGDWALGPMKAVSDNLRSWGLASTGGPSYGVGTVT